MVGPYNSDAGAAHAFLRMMESGATRQQVADVIGVDVKTIYKYLPAT
ncbi:helix-turn-helix domain-containing protein [Klebsiella pneumoniae]|nr:helix-turn-helix domain-containing protein [Klebsiella pneumoniae]MDF1935480.1 helix-turn-helix domain-containing protein [Klebsiella pneumoniae]MDF1951384.1 helix-turn-helix domain-containing protein [Klebsiella pneumoniae]MDF1968435.1 helix-turn-helix domain-containing protein [Klebsiella pneumoniae]MDF1974722.1 helix-turn-helix domain-containing protein [Klebsiella pneumoniae]MDF1979730.1 helix-turn-helix domain-containing protein [Klebsiella pneumoniae]